MWLQQGVSNRHSFLRQCKQRLRDIYIQNWSELTNLKSSCLLYKHFHVDFKLSKYLILVNVKKHRLALTNFRLKKHKLPNIIKGRGQARLPYNERLCDTCDTLGDEYHCIFECIKTEHIRHILPDYYIQNPCMYKFIQLLSSENQAVIRKLAKFVHLINI